MSKYSKCKGPEVEGTARAQQNDQEGEEMRQKGQHRVGGRPAGAWRFEVTPGSHQRLHHRVLRQGWWVPICILERSV
jgi:hypothetical protein